MTVVRGTAKLLSRLRQPAKPPEPQPGDNPLGEWYADLDHWRRMPFVLMLNAATGVILVLPGNAANLRRLHVNAAVQFAALCTVFGIHGPAFEAEARALDAGFAFARTCDRSLLGSMNERKFAVWMQFEHNDLPAEIAAALEWEGLFKHPALGRNARYQREYHTPLDLLRQRLMPGAAIIDLARRRRT